MIHYLSGYEQELNVKNNSVSTSIQLQIFELDEKEIADRFPFYTKQLVL